MIEKEYNNELAGNRDERLPAPTPNNRVKAGE